MKTVCGIVASQILTHKSQIGNNSEETLVVLTMKCEIQDVVTFESNCNSKFENPAFQLDTFLQFY